MNKVLSVSVASLVSCLFLFSCQMQCNTCEFQSITIDLDEHTVELQRLSLIKDIRIVRLETNDSVLVGRIDKVLIHDGKIYIGDFLLANVEALTQDEKPEPPKMGYRIVSYILEPPCYVAFPGLSPTDPPQLVKGKTPVCMYVEGGELAGCPDCMIG